jgi:hypothetical protein
MALNAELKIQPARAQRNEELVAVCSLTNDGDEPLEVTLGPLSSASLCLAIQDEAGSPVLLPPPPVPGGAVETTRIDAGRRLTVEHPAFLPSWTPPGHYRARFRYVAPSSPAGVWAGELHSDWTEFDVTG